MPRQGASGCQLHGGSSQELGQGLGHMLYFSFSRNGIELGIP